MVQGTDVSDDRARELLRDGEVDVLGRMWQLSTVQFDFNLPARFELEYKGEDGEMHRPVMVHHYPASIKAFYMQPDAERPDLALSFDMLAPEGYGEIIGGSQRIHDYEFLLKRLKDNNLPVEPFQWYLDLRRYGSVPHAGFGLGLERTVAWICGAEHIREVIPFPRMIYRVYP